MTETVVMILILFILISAVAAAWVRELVSAVFLLGAFSFFIAVLWGITGAADVSFTEAMVGVGASTIFFLLALFRTAHFAKPPVCAYRPLWALPVLGALGLLLFWASFGLPEFGNIETPANTYVSPYYIKHAVEDSHTPNVVTAILADYRSLDTLIETAVVFAAGVSCLLLMRRTK